MWSCQNQRRDRFARKALVGPGRVESMTVRSARLRTLYRYVPALESLRGYTVQHEITLAQSHLFKKPKGSPSPGRCERLGDDHRRRIDPLLFIGIGLAASRRPMSKTAGPSVRTAPRPVTTSTSVIARHAHQSGASQSSCPRVSIVNPAITAHCSRKMGIGCFLPATVRVAAAISTSM